MQRIILWSCDFIKSAATFVNLRPNVCAGENGMNLKSMRNDVHNDGPHQKKKNVVTLWTIAFHLIPNAFGNAELK